MKLFTSNEVLVKTGYAKFASIFKPNQIVNWSMYAGGSEVVHEKAYSLFTETIGLPNSVYTEFLDIPVMKSKTTYIDKAKVKKWEDYKSMGLSDIEADTEFRKAVARMLAVYGAGTEAITLYAQFAMLLQFKLKGKYSGLCQIVEYSIRDEFTHHLGNAEIFRKYISENQDIWNDELKFDIYESIREIVAYEDKLIDYLNPDDKDSYKKYVRYQANQALKELGMKPNWEEITNNPFQFMEIITSSVLTDFFSNKVTQYSKKMLGSRDELRNKIKLLNESKKLRKI
jgi:ribonucleoside-diphosphate reductase beta chain